MAAALWGRAARPWRVAVPAVCRGSGVVPGAADTPSQRTEQRPGSGTAGSGPRQLLCCVSSQNMKINGKPSFCCKEKEAGIEATSAADCAFIRFVGMRKTHLEYSMQLWDPQYMIDGASPGEATKMITELEHLSYEEDRLRELGAVQPREEKALGRPYCILST